MSSEKEDFDSLIKGIEEKYQINKTAYENHQQQADDHKILMLKYKKMLEVNNALDVMPTLNVHKNKSIDTIEFFAIELIKKTKIPQKNKALFNYYIEHSADKKMEERNYSSRINEIRNRRKTIKCQRFKGMQHGDDLINGLPEWFTGDKLKQEYRDKVVLHEKKKYIPKKMKVLSKTG